MQVLLIFLCGLYIERCPNLIHIELLFTALWGGSAKCQCPLDQLLRHHLLQQEKCLLGKASQTLFSLSGWATDNKDHIYMCILNPVCVIESLCLFIERPADVAISLHGSCFQTQTNIAIWINIISVVTYPSNIHIVGLEQFLLVFFQKHTKHFSDKITIIKLLSKFA